MSYSYTIIIVWTCVHVYVPTLLFNTCSCNYASCNWNCMWFPVSCIYLVANLALSIGYNLTARGPLWCTFGISISNIFTYIVLSGVYFYIDWK